MELEKKLKIRNAELRDADFLVTLTEEFGYKITIDEIIDKIKRILTKNDQEIYVAELEYVIGWIHISLIEPLESDSFVEVRGIVVNKSFRGKGIGTKLINTAVDWARIKKCCKIRVRTNIKRIETREKWSMRKAKRNAFRF